MLSQINQKKIKSKLKDIYNYRNSEINIDLRGDELIEIIDKFNRKIKNFRKYSFGYMLWK